MQSNSYTLPSTLSTGRRDIIVSYDPSTHQVTASLSPNELVALYRRIPLHIPAHAYELTPSTLLFNVLAECMKGAYKQKVKLVEPVATDVEAGGDDLESDHPIAFYNALFPVLDALADLEEKINRFHEGAIHELLQTLDGYEAKMKRIFDVLLDEPTTSFTSNSHANHYEQYVTECRDRILNKDILRFRKNINDYNNPNNTQALLFNYSVNNNIKPLGIFVIEQVKRIQKLLADYQRLEEHFSGQNDYFEKSKASQQLGVLREDALAFQESCVGVRFSSGQPFSEKIIALLRVAGGSTQALTETQYSVVLNDFIAPEKQTDLNEWEKFFCLLSSEQPKTVGYANLCEGVYYVSAITTMAVIEVAMSVSLRFPSNILIGFLLANYQASLELIDAIPGVNHAYFTAAKQANEKRIVNITQAMDSWHHFITSEYGVSACRKERDLAQMIYYASDNSAKKRRSVHRLSTQDLSSTLEKLNNNPRIALVREITQQSKSPIAYTVIKKLSPEFFYEKTFHGYKSMVDFFYSPLARDPSYFSQKIKYFFKPEQQILLQNLIQDLAKHQKNIPAALYPLAGCDVLADTVESPLLPGSTVDQHLEDHCTHATENPFIRAHDLVIEVNPSESIMDFIEMLALEFSSLMNSIFVKLPLASTLALMFSFVAFSSAYLHMGGPLPILLDDLSRSFTGSSSVGSEFRMLLASFLLWKLTTLSIESLFAVIKLDPHFLEKLYGDPERIFLIFSTFLGLGLLIQLFPLLPETINLFSRGISGILFGMYPQMIKDFCNAILSMYPAMANVFIIEARQAWHGQIPFNFLEYFFLGLKSVFLIGALFSGYHKPHLQADAKKYQRVIQKLQEINVEKSDQVLAAHYIIQLYDAAGLTMDRNAAQHLYDFLHANKADSNVLDNLYNHAIFKGSNNLLQILFIFPGFFITYPYRMAKYLLAVGVNSPVMQHEVMKSFCEDITMFTQVMTALGENFRSFILSVNQLLKFMIALFIGVPLHYLGLVDFKNFNRDVQKYCDMQNNILWLPKLAATPFVSLCNNPYSFKTSYGSVAHAAGTEEGNVAAMLPSSR